MDFVAYRVAASVLGWSLAGRITCSLEELALMVTPELSVVMGVYNGAGSLRETIDSVLSQEGVNLELIVVNDGSTDSTGEILAEYTSRDSRINVLSQENQG